MKISAITHILEQWAPLSYAEDFDNVGLLVGNKEANCENVLIAHDVSEAVVEEAVGKNCQMIICFHPIIFKGLKSLTGKNYVEKTVIKAIENKIAIYALHTALDNHKKGINYTLGETLGLKNQRILIPQKNTLFQLTTYVPSAQKTDVLAALHKAGAGSIGHYSQCSFTVTGEGQFLGDNHSTPQQGTKESLSKLTEDSLRVIVPKHCKKQVIDALQDSHPYESVAYELIAVENLNPDIGLGSIGELEQSMSLATFLEHTKTSLKVPAIRHSASEKDQIKKVAVLGGSGSFCINAAIAQGADALVTADLKYHDFYTPEKGLLLVDAGHYETEHFTKKIIQEFLTKKIPNFAFTLSEVNTNPVKYF
ncbi:MAG: Nif3-like dinuclear metal center hexameric protein [Flavobacteriaceae bacterium]|nr:Nif3-like dinuclear metal center hexameric protein [Flavobacteriaceae bacterium]